MHLSKCAMYNSKKLKFVKELEAKGLLGHLLEAKLPTLIDILLLVNN